MSRERYKALLDRMVQWASEESGVKPGKIPTNEQQDLISERLSQSINNAKMFHLEPERHEQQSYFLRAQAPIVVAHTGNKWGKTFALLVRGLVASLGCAPWDPENTALFNPIEYEPPLRVILVVQDYSTALPLDILPRLKELIPWEALVTSVSRVQGQVIDAFKLWNGTEWKILSHSQEDKSFEGWSAHLVLWNEPMPYSKFIGALRGCVEFNARHVMSFTPISEPWLYDRVYLPSHRIVDRQSFLDSFTQRPEVIVVEGSIEQNPYLPREAVERFLANIPESQRAARQFGQWAHLAGRVYRNFNRSTHVRELAELVGADEGAVA